MSDQPLPDPARNWLADFEGRDFTIDGAYRAVVRFSERDTATICCLRGGPAHDAAKMLLGAGEAVKAAMDADAEASLVDVLRDLLCGEAADDLWAAVDSIFATSLVKWSVPEMREVYFPDSDVVPVPNAGMVAEERLLHIKALPIRVIVRVIAGAVLLGKNC